MSKTIVTAMLLCIAATAPAEAHDLKKLLKDALPCKSAAIRLCDRSQGITAAALWNCGAALAANQQQIGQRCVDVLKRYGQL